VADTTPEVGQTLEISGKRWNITDHSSYGNNEGFHVDEWECERQNPSETRYLLRETDAEVRWYFTRPIPLSAVSISGGKPFGDVVATLAKPPDTLVYRGLAHGLDETTDGRYAEEPGESVQKTTWDYWDAKHEVNLAIERWADGRVDCYHGRRIEPAQVVVLGGAGGASGTLSSVIWASVIAGVVVLVLMMFGGTLEPALTAMLGAAVLVALAMSLRGSGRIRGGWITAALVLGVLFASYPPLTTVEGLAVLLLVPAALTRWIAMAPADGTATPARAACIAVAGATLAAGLYDYYRFAPVPRSFDQFVIAVGPAPLTGLVACLVAWMVLRTSRAS
jgi:hypothetical protein